MINAIYLRGNCRQLRQGVHAVWLGISRLIEHPFLPDANPPSKLVALGHFASLGGRGLYVYHCELLKKVAAEF